MPSEIRRNLLTVVGATLLFPSFVAAGVVGVKSRDQAREIAWSLSQIFDDLSAVGGVGRKYLQNYRSESDVNFLVIKVFGSSPPTEPGRLASRLGERCKTDFHTGNVVILDGWILARSEVRACAIITLTMRNDA